VELSDKPSSIPINQVRLIPFDRFPGKLNMAIDCYLSTKCQSNDVPIFRFYGWSPYCVSIGYHQKDDLVDFDKLEKAGLDIVRRPTGGRAIFHAEELTYSMVVPRNQIHHRVLYYFIHQIFNDALNSLGYPVELKNDNEKLGGLTHAADDFPCFTKSAQTEVQYKDKKLIGSAQKIYHGTILQHGSLLIGNEHEDLSRYLKARRDTRDSIQKEIKEKTISLNEIAKDLINPEKIIESIVNQLELARGISVNSQKLSRGELDSAQKMWTKVNEHL
jgi:lipoate-protein ligase A